MSLSMIFTSLNTHDIHQPYLYLNIHLKNMVNEFKIIVNLVLWMVNKLWYIVIFINLTNSLQKII